MHEATAAASISDGLVHGSFPVLEPNEYKAFDIMPLVVETDPSPAAGLPFQTATALRIMEYLPAAVFTYKPRTTGAL